MCHTFCQFGSEQTTSTFLIIVKNKQNCLSVNMTFDGISCRCSYIFYANRWKTCVCFYFSIGTLDTHDTQNQTHSYTSTYYFPVLGGRGFDWCIMCVAITYSRQKSKILQTVRTDKNPTRRYKEYLNTCMHKLSICCPP